MRFKLKSCPFCGGRFRWYYKRSIGQRMLSGYAMCEGCGCKVGEGLVCFDDEDLRCEIAELVNNRVEERE